jgi:hypothetical protein
MELGIIMSEDINIIIENFIRKHSRSIKDICIGTPRFENYDEIYKLLKEIQKY